MEHFERFGLSLAQLFFQGWELSTEEIFLPLTLDHKAHSAHLPLPLHQPALREVHSLEPSL